METLTFRVRFHYGEHLVTMHYNDTELIIEVEEVKSGHKWGGRYSLQYIEEITRKTGSFKKFSTFVKMLQTALDGGTVTVSADFLSQQDLEIYKKSRAQTAPQVTQTRRYLIVTYAVEFDCVRYPLPLIYDEPTTETLQQTLDRLAQELAGIKSGQDAELLEMAKENEVLSSQLSKLRHHQTVAASRKPQPEIEGLITTKKSLEEERRQLEAYKNSSLSELRKRSTELEGELNYLSKELDSLLSEAERRAERKEKAGKTRHEMQSLQGDCARTSNSVNSLKRELGAVTDRLFKLREAEERQKLKVSQLESDLEAAIKESKEKAAAKRSAGSSRNTSPANRVQVATRQRTPPTNRPEVRTAVRTSPRTAAPAQRPIRTSPAESRPARISPNRSSQRPARVSPGRRVSPSAPKRGGTGNIDERLSRLQDLIANLKT
mmetsp:Transcript_34639/g.60915  ORF Transcript_34639/g.60915 Transcript_34639/m.60915 type:complete len:434 (-) Transcript_34639:35-1336(-)